MSFKGIGAVVLFIIVMFSLIRKNILQHKRLKKLKQEEETNAKSESLNK